MKARHIMRQMWGHDYLGIYMTDVLWVLKYLDYHHGTIVVKAYARLSGEDPAPYGMTGKEVLDFYVKTQGYEKVRGYFEELRLALEDWKATTARILE